MAPLLAAFAATAQATSRGASASAPVPVETGAGYAYYAVGAPDAATPGPVRPGLMLVGGGEWPRDAFEWWLERAGNGHVLVLRASGADELQREIHEDIGGTVSVETVVFSGREAAGDPAILARVRRADGIFLAGGDQSKYVRYWKGTPLSEALERHVRAGKPLAGTSAGLAVMGAFSYGALDGGSLTSSRALADPWGPAVTLVDDFLELPPLPPGRVITDSHFSERGRLGRLIVFLARLAAERGIADLRGIGVDESTALCIDERGRGRVFTRRGGMVWLVSAGTLADLAEAGEAPRPFREGSPEPGRPLDLHGTEVVALGPRSRLRLPDFEVERPAARYRADVERGQLRLRPLE